MSKEHLTPREYDILLLCAIFGSQKEVAHLIGLSLQHVKNTLQEAYWKLGVNSLSQATIRMGWTTYPVELKVYQIAPETLKAQMEGDFSMLAMPQGDIEGVPI